MKTVLIAAGLALAITACGRAEPKQLNPESVIKGVNYVGMSVSDLDQSSDFYRSANLSEVDRSQLENSPAINALAGRDGVVANTRMLRSVNAQVRLMQFSDSPSFSSSQPVPVQGPGIAHICYQVAASTETYQSFLSKGAEAIGDPDLIQLSARNPVYYGYVKDLDGAVVEVEHVDIEKLNLPEPPENQYRVRHVSLATPDIDRLVEFYSVLLDQPNPRRVAGKNGIGNEKTDGVSGLEGSKIRMAWFQIRNLELEMFQYVSHPTEAPLSPRPVDAVGYNMIVFDVLDLDAATAKFIEAGGTIDTARETMDGGEIVFGRDPDGNIIGLQTAPADALVSSQNFSGNGT